MHGYTLLEVLISLLLLSLMLLGLDILQLNTMRETKTNVMLSIANNQLENFCELLKITTTNADKTFLNAWQKYNKTILANSVITIDDAHPIYHLTLTWGGEKLPCVTMHNQNCLRADCMV